MNKKIMAFFAMSLLALLALTGCGNTDNDAETADVDVSAIMERMKEAFELPAMMSVEGAELEKEFYLQPDQVEQYDVYASMTIVHADNLAIVKASSEEYVGTIKEALRKRQADVIRAFEDYLPGPLVVAQNARIVESGRYVALLMVEDVDKAEDIFFEMVGQ